VLLAKDSPAERPRINPADYIRILRSRDALRFCVFYSVTFGGFVGLSSYLAIFFRDQYGLSKVSAGDLTAVCVFAGSFARPLGGVLADRLGGIRVLLGLLAAIGVAALALATMPALALAGVLFFATMALLGMGNGAVFQLVPQRFSQQMGVLTGLVGFAGGVGGFLLPFLLGTLKDLTGTYATGFALFALMSVGAAGMLVLAMSGWQQTRAPREVQADS
jgi:NNP family nitrate/nitrite transporter-like MFS transporter